MTEQTKEIIQEGDGFSFYKENGKFIFELENFGDYNVYIKGLKEQSNREWRRFPVTAELTKRYAEHRGSDFTVKYNGQLSQPAQKGF